MGNFNLNLLNNENKSEISEFHEALSSHFFAPYILQPTIIVKNSKILIDNIFLNSVKFSSCSANLTSKISNHPLKILVL